MVKNKKGLIDQITIVLIMAVALAFIILVFWAGSMVLPVLIGTGKQVTNQMQITVQQNNPNSDIANATSVSTSTANGILGIGETIVYIALLVLFVGFIMLAFYVRTYPFLAFFWVFIIIALVFMSMFVSNAYLTASQGDLKNFYSDWGSNDFLMSNLPIIVAVVGVFGGIFLFVLASKEPESEVQTL